MEIYLLEDYSRGGKFLTTPYSNFENAMEALHEKVREFKSQNETDKIYELIRSEEKNHEWAYYFYDDGKSYADYRIRKTVLR